MRHPLIQSEGISRPKGIYKASRHAIIYLVYTGGKPLSIPDYRIEGRVFELVNELALVKLSCKYTIFNGGMKQLITTTNLLSSHSKKTSEVSLLLPVRFADSAVVTRGGENFNISGEIKSGEVPR